MDDIDTIEQSLAEIMRAYRWGEAAVYGTSGASASEGGKTPTHESRPAENQAISAAERSGSLRETAAMIRKIRMIVTQEARRLEPKPATTERPDQFPPLISPQEHDRLSDAKRRRESRGEGWGRG
jgi:hypothetical protein